jgi:hypothetical protein
VFEKWKMEKGKKRREESMLWRVAPSGGPSKFEAKEGGGKHGRLSRPGGVVVIDPRGH